MNRPSIHNSFKRASSTCYFAFAILCNQHTLAFKPSFQGHILSSKQITRHNSSFHSSTHLSAAPKRGSKVDSYQTVSVNCNTCRQRLFRYKKKNGTKSNLIKCYVERIVEAEDASLQRSIDDFSKLAEEDYRWCCPKCNANFARSAIIRGLPALKLVGGKTRMTKK